MCDSDVLTAILAELCKDRIINVNVDATEVGKVLDGILTELKELRQDIANKPARVFIPEDVRRALGADSVSQAQDGNLCRLVVWFGQVPGRVSPTESVAYTALSSEVFTTEEAIEAIQRQRPEVAV
jgi:hypothetical protein